MHFTMFIKFIQFTPWSHHYMYQKFGNTFNYLEKSLNIFLKEGS